MKLSVPAHHFREAVAWTAKHAQANPNAPVLGGLTLTTRGDSTLILRATDWQVWATHSALATVLTDGEVTVSARLLADVVKALPADGTVDIVSEDGSNVLVTGGRARASLPVLSEPVPPGPEPGEYEHEIDAGALARVLEVSARICHRAALPEHAVVGLDPRSDGLRTLSTDRFHLLACRVPWATDDITEEYPALTLQPATARAVAALAKGAGTVSLAFPADLDHHSAVFGAETASRRVVARLGAGEYSAQLLKLLSQSGRRRLVTVDGRDLASLVKRVAALGEVAEDHRMRHVRLTVAGGAVEVAAGGWEESARAGITDYLDAELGEEWTADPWPEGITVNAQYLVNVLDGFPAGGVRIALTAPTKPAVIRPAEGDSATALLMPVRTK